MGLCRERKEEDRVGSRWRLKKADRQRLLEGHGEARCAGLNGKSLGGGERRWDPICNPGNQVYYTQGLDVPRCPAPSKVYRVDRAHGTPPLARDSAQVTVH